MPLSDYQAVLNGLTIGAGTTYEFEGPVDGLGVPAPRTADLELPTGGVLGGRDLPSVRVITIQVAILAASASAAMTAVAALNTAWAPSSTDQTLDIRLPGMGTVRWTGRPRGVDVDLDRIISGVARARLIFDALNPIGVVV
jgi:hypothetical protein